MNDASSKPATPRLTHRRALRVAGVIALLLGAAVMAVAALLASPTWLIIGAVAAGTGAIWWLCSRFAPDEPMRAVHKRYMREFFPAMLAYIVVLPLSIILLQQFAMPPLLKALVVLLPVLPVLLLVRAMSRFMRGLDELQRRIQIEAVSLTCAIVGTVTFALGFLQGAKLLPTVAGEMIWVLPGMIAVWGVVVALISRRYRDE